MRIILVLFFYSFKLTPTNFPYYKLIWISKKIQFVSLLYFKKSCLP